MSESDRIDERTRSRADLLPEEVAAGSADPTAQAAEILADSDLRSADPNAAPGSFLERRRSEDTVAPDSPGASDAQD